MRELTDGAGVPVVYDSVGTDDLPALPGLAGRRGLLVCFGTASGPMPPIDAMQLAVKGSLFVTRPALADYIADRDERAALAGELFGHVARGPDPVEINQRYALDDAVRAHRDLESGRSVGSSVFSLESPVADRLRPHPLPPHRMEIPCSHLVDTPEQDRFRSFTVGPRSIEVAPLTATIGAELRQRQPGRGRARTTPSSPSSRRCCCSTRCCSSATRTSAAAEHVALAERFGQLEDHPVAGSDPDHPGLVRIYKDLDSPPEHYENAFHCDATWREAPPMGSVLRCVETPRGRRRHDLGEHGRGLPAAARARAGPDRRACGPGTASRPASARRCPTEQRPRLHARFPDAEHPVVRTHPETARRSSSSTRFTTHFVNCHTPENVRFGFDYAPGASELLNYLVRQAFVPEYQVRWRWTPNSFAIWDNRCDPALRRSGLLARRPQDGARGNRRHPAF